MALFTTCTFNLDRPLVPSKLDKFRGFIAVSHPTEPLYHGHVGDGFRYGHPLIQYKVIEGRPMILGLGEGALALRSLGRYRCLDLGWEEFRVVGQDTVEEEFPLALSDAPVRYSFATPWLALSEANYPRYLEVRDRTADRENMLASILTGNILSLAKTIGWRVQGRIKVRHGISEAGAALLKGRARLLQFEGWFEANVRLPGLWGIGKAAARGYGTLVEK